MANSIILMKMDRLSKTLSFSMAMTTIRLLKMDRYIDPVGMVIPIMIRMVNSSATVLLNLMENITILTKMVFYTKILLSYVMKKMLTEMT